MAFPQGAVHVGAEPQSIIYACNCWQVTLVSGQVPGEAFQTKFLRIDGKAKDEIRISIRSALLL